jgi:hypothetical protein
MLLCLGEGLVMKEKRERAPNLRPCLCTTASRRFLHAPFWLTSGTVLEIQQNGTVLKSTEVTVLAKRYRFGVVLLRR